MEHSSSSSSSSSSSPPSSSCSSYSSSSSLAELEREFSIQNEPKAMSDEEFKLAREAALEVIHNYSREEALKIFLQGLERPVTTSVKLTWEWELEDLSMSDCDEES